MSPPANDNHLASCIDISSFKPPRTTAVPPCFGAGTHYHYGPAGELLAETDETGAVKREYVYLGNLPVAQIDGATGEVFFIHADHLGTPQAVTDALGQLAWEDAYQPFGTATNTGQATAVAMDLRFPGQRLDGETGYHYNYFRDYDPSLGRYLQSDPIGLGGGLNTYAYVGGNPVGRVDPTGENPALALLAYTPEIAAAAAPFIGDVLSGVGLGYLADKYFNENADAQDGAQAPGCPTDDDGYISPKNWDGKKVKAPNGRGYGYPDKNGKVWVPTGPRPGSAHGGPHWDVQNPKGGYENIYPSGKKR